MKRTRALVAIVGGTGLMLTAFQNCGPSFQMNQDLTNQQLVLDSQKENDSLTSGVQSLQMLKVAPSSSCLSGDLKLGWPLGGTPYADWNVVNYVDDDPTSGIMDFTSAIGNKAITYNGHQGVDIAVPDFRYMDGNFPVLAAAAGKVVNLNQSSFDRNLVCNTTQPWNFVAIRHANGYLTIYGHLKQNSVVVRVGDNVVAGQKLAVVGSSGCSTSPHVHFEVWNCSNAVIDSMKLGMFTAPPIYSGQAPTTLMQVVVKQPAITSVNQMIDPGNDTSAVAVGSPLSVGVTLANLKTTDLVTYELIDPKGVMRASNFSIANSGFYGQSHWWGNMNFNIAGVWTVNVVINGARQRQIQIAAK